MLAEDRYGLLARGFREVGRYRVQALGASEYHADGGSVIIQLPTCGCYEGVQWAYVEDFDE